MRIFSKYHDYYDTSLSYGIDTNIIYKRDLKEIFVNNDYDIEKIINPVIDILHTIPNYIQISTDSMKRRYQFEINSKILGYCGKLYPCFSFKDNHYYTVESFVNDISNEDLKSEGMSRKDFEKAMYSHNDLNRMWKKYSTNLPSSKWEYMLDNLVITTYDSIFIELDVPLFLLNRDYHNGYTLILNPILKNIQFYKIEDPVSAFQDISMYLGNQLVKRKDPSYNIPDEILRDEKGFDKWSFKKMPTKK